MRKFLVTIILLVTMVLSNWAASSYNAMLPSTGRDFWLTYMDNWGKSASQVELQLYAVAKSATTITVTAADGTVITSQAVAAGEEFVYTLTETDKAKVYNTGSDIPEAHGLHVTSSSGEIALYMRNGFKDSDDYSYDISPVFQTHALGKEYMIQTYTRDMSRTEMAIVATEDGTQVTITLSQPALKNDGTNYSVGETINLLLDKGQVYQLKGVADADPTQNLTGTTVAATKPVAVFNGGIKTSVPHKGGANGDHTFEQSIPVEAWGQHFVLQEMSGFPVLDDDESLYENRAVQYYVTAIYDNTEIKVNGVLKKTLQKGESYQINIEYNKTPQVVESGINPVICYAYMSNNYDNEYNGKSYGEPSMALIPAMEKGVQEVMLYTHNTPMTLHYANVAVPSAGLSGMRLNGTDVSSQFTTIYGGYAFARLRLDDGVNTISNADSRFVAIAYDVETDKALSDAYATVFNMASAAPKVYIGDELVDDGYTLDYCNKHPGIPFRAEVDYPHDSIKWVFGDGEEHVVPAGSDYTDQHTYNLSVHSTSETNHIKFITYHHTPIANTKLSDTVSVDLVVYPAYYFHIYDTICGSTGSYTWTLPDGVTTINTYTFNRADNLTKEDKVEYQTTVGLSCDSIYYLHLRVYPETVETFSATICQSETYNNGNFHINGRTLDPQATPYDFYDTLVGENQYHCDSIRHLKLTVLRSDSTEFNVTECDKYTWTESGLPTFTASGDYVHTFTNAVGCDSVVTLHLTIKNSSTNDTLATICDNQLPYHWHGKQLNAAGTLKDTLVNAVGCDSIVTLTLTVNQVTYGTESAEICSSELPYSWHSKTLAAAGTLKDTLVNATGCDSIVTFTLTVKQVTKKTLNKTICDNELPYTWPELGVVFDAAGTQYDTLVNAAGCDSILTLKLKVNQRSYSDTADVVCENKLPYHWHGKSLDAAGSLKDTLVNAVGCDSIVTLTLTVKPISITADTKTICSNELPYTWNSVVFTAAGTKADTLVNSVGCDSIVSMTLIVNAVTSSDTTATVCKNEFPYLWHGKQLNAAGTLKDTLTNTAGCDSIITLTLTVGADTESDTLATVCSSQLPYSWHGKTLAGSGQLKDTIRNAVGCDSIITLKLTIIPSSQSDTAATVCEAELPYQWHGKQLNVAGTLKDTLTNAAGCDSIVTLTLTVQPTPAINSMSVDAEEKCKDIDTEITLNYTVSAGAIQYNYIVFATDGSTASPLPPHPAPHRAAGATSITGSGNTSADPIQINISSLPAGDYEIRMVVRSSAGCESDTARQAFVIHPVPDPTPIQETDTICMGDTLIWNGIECTTGGTYNYTAKYNNGCDSAYYTLTLTELKPKTVNKDTTICAQHPSYLWHTYRDTLLNESGTYHDTLPYTNGCDSILYTLTLTLNEITPDRYDTATICQMSTYHWFTRSYDCRTLSIGAHDFAINDTILPGECGPTNMYLHLTVEETIPDTTFATICHGDSYDWHVEGQLIMHNLTETCVQNYTKPDDQCDKLYRLELTVLDPIVPKDEGSITLCATDAAYDWRGHSLTGDGTYYDTVPGVAANGCDSIYKVRLIRQKMTIIDHSDHICEGDDYIWNGTTLPASELSYGVHHLYDTLPPVAPATCPSIVNHLLLTVTRPYIDSISVIECDEYTWRGRHYTKSTRDTVFIPATETSCDSTLILKLTLGKTVELWDAEVITEDQLPYTWHNQTLTHEGTAIDKKHHPETGCDSIWHFTLAVNELIPDTVRDTICDNEGKLWYGIVYNTPGKHTLKTSDGKSHVLILTVNPTYAEDVYYEDCATSYTWHEQTYTASGNYTWSSTSTTGCDSTETLHLTLIDNTPHHEARTVCPGEQVRWGQENYTAVAGETKVLTRTNQCGVNETLTVTVRDAVTGEQTETACASFTWNGNTYTESGDYEWRGQSVTDCDSIATLHLTILPKYIFEESVDIDETAVPYEWTGHHADIKYSETGHYYDSLTTVDGCDSIYHLFLSIGFITRDTVPVTACDEYQWKGQTLTTSDLYTDTIWNDAHNKINAIDYLQLTINRSVHVEEAARQYCEGESFDWKGQTYTLTAGEHDLVHNAQTPEGCDSITTMHVTIHSKYGHAENATVCWTELPYIWRGIACNEAKTYADTVLSLNGCDSILTLTLSIEHPQTPAAEDEQEICLSNTYTWHGMDIHKSEIGTYDYYYRYKNPGDCDSITDHLTLTVKENEVDTIHDISCYGADYTWTVENDIVLFHGDPTADLWKVDTIHNPLCDHIYVLDLKILPEAVTVTTDTTICAGSDYLWAVNGQSYSQAGLYADTLRSVLSECDSVIRQLNLKVRPVIENPITLQLCEGSNYIFFGEEFTNLQAGTTIEREHIEKYVGCDCDSAITTLSLTVVPTLIDETPQIVTCGTYVWNDVTPERTYTNISNVPNAENLYINDTVITQDGQCATKHILHLTLQPTYYLQADTIVRSLPVVYKGIKFESPGAIVTLDTTVTMHASTTCDSTYHITVVKTDQELKTETATICEGETLNWRGGTYTTAGSYVNTTAHPDTVYTLVLTVNPMTRHDAESVTTCDETYTWHGHTFTESAICYDTVAGQGDACAEIYTLKLTMMKAEATSEYDTICTHSYTWDGRGNYTIAGTDTMLLSSYKLSCGETITDTMRVHVWPTATSEESMTTCENEPVIWNGNQYNASGDYTWRGATIHGCDSVVTLHLTVLPYFLSDEHLEVAEGPLEWRGQWLTEDGIYTDSLTKVENGCDSIYRVNFHINIAERDTTRKEECGSYTWSQTGETYTESTTARDTVWNATHTNYTVYSLELTIWPKYDYVGETDTVSIKSGESYEWYNNQYTTSGDYTHMVTTVHGCDSLLASLHLIVGDPIINDIFEEACENEGYDFKGHIYTESTTLYDSLKTAEGLDSINVIHLTILPIITNTLDTIVCEKFEWNGFEFRNDTILEIRFSSVVTGCDSIDRLILTITDSIILVPGNELTIDELGYCPGDTAYIPYNLLQGNPTEYKLDFNPAAITQGFVGHDYESLNGHQDIPIAIPGGCDYGTYEAILQLTDGVSESKEHRFRFTVAYDGVLHTMWTDVLAIDNSKGLFFGYRWYRDGILVQDAGKQYYNQNGEALKGEYRAGLMLENGMWIYTCPLYVDMTNEPLSLTAMPCPAPKGMPVTLTIHGADLETLANGILTVYSTAGQIVYRREGAEHQQQVDLTAGQYIGVFRTNDDRSVNVKFLVY